MIKSLLMTTHLNRFEQTVLYCFSLTPPPPLPPPPSPLPLPSSHEFHTSSAGVRITSNKSAVD